MCGVKDISLFGKVTWENICHIGLSFGLLIYDGSQIKKWEIVRRLWLNCFRHNQVMTTQLMLLTAKGGTNLMFSIFGFAS